MARRPQLAIVPAALPQFVSRDDFYAYMPQHKYMYIPTRQLWAGVSVNARLGQIGNISATAWLDANRPIEQFTWSPGDLTLIRDRLMVEGGWLDKDGVASFNLYRPPTIARGNPAGAARWLDHVATVFPADAQHIIRWFAHRVQFPEQKCNHCLVLGGSTGIGKDSLIEPLKHAVGRWNFQEIAPSNLLQRFNGFLRCVVLRISEARDLGELNRYQFYDHMKVIAAAPPDTLRIDEKHLAEYYIPNLLGVLITTNYKTDGMFLPPDDRRTYVAWSEKKLEDFEDAYWNSLWQFYDNGGLDDVAAYLTDLDLCEWDAKAPPAKTPAFWAIANSQRGPEEAELNDLLDTMGRPAATTIEAMTLNADYPLKAWLEDRKNRRVIGHRLERCAYERLNNDLAADGLWKIGGARRTVYVNMACTSDVRWRAAHNL